MWFYTPILWKPSRASLEHRARGDRFRAVAAHCAVLDLLCFGEESRESYLLLVPRAKPSGASPQSNSLGFVKKILFPQT